MIDGFEVTVGDEIFDVTQGRGTVSSINADGSFMVTFGRRALRYNADGSIGNSTVVQLSWQDLSELPRPLKGEAGALEVKAMAELWRTFRKLSEDKHG